MGNLRIFQLNAGTLFEPDWDERRVRLVAMLAHWEPDVVCFQEIIRRGGGPTTADWVADADDRHWYRAFGGSELTPRPGVPVGDGPLEFGSAVLSRWPIEQLRCLNLRDLPATSGKRGGVPFEVLHVTTAGLDVFSAHLAAAPTDGVRRCGQVLAIDQLITDASADRDRFDPFIERRKGMPPILCGDFNAEPDSDEIRFLCGLTELDGRTTFYQDAWRVAGDGGPGLTQDWTRNPYAADLNVHRKRIDYVFIGDAFRRAGDAGRIQRAWTEDGFDGSSVSDHAAVIVDVTWPDRPAD